jgi:acyl carrier protein
MTRTEIDQLVVNTFKRVLSDNEKTMQGEPGVATPIMGTDSPFDSVDLVTFIVALEQALEDDWNVSVILADDRAMSQESVHLKVSARSVIILKNWLMKTDGYKNDHTDNRNT